MLGLKLIQYSKRALGHNGWTVEIPRFLVGLHHVFEWYLLIKKNLIESIIRPRKKHPVELYNLYCGFLCLSIVMYYNINNMYYDINNININNYSDADNQSRIREGQIPLMLKNMCPLWIFSLRTRPMIDANTVSTMLKCERSYRAVLTFKLSGKLTIRSFYVAKSIKGFSQTPVATQAANYVKDIDLAPLRNVSHFLPPQCALMWTCENRHYVMASSKPMVTLSTSEYKCTENLRCPKTKMNSINLITWSIFLHLLRLIRT